MRSSAERSTINRALMSHGLGQLGYLIADHDEFRQLLVRCEPADRRAMYDSMKPYLRFEAKAFDTYIIEAQREAEAKQLPILDAETGELRQYRAPEIGMAQTALEEGLAKGHLEVVCRKCTRVEVFSGLNKADAIKKAREAGWTYNELLGDGREICPICP